MVRGRVAAPLLATALVVALPRCHETPPHTSQRSPVPAVRRPSRPAANDGGAPVDADAGGATDADADASDASDAEAASDAATDATGALACDPRAPEKKIQVYVERGKPPADDAYASWTLVLRVPALKLRKTDVIEGAARCRSQLRKASQRLSVVCVYSEASDEHTVANEGGVLVGTIRHTAYFSSPPPREWFRQTLPCGARLVFHKLNYRDPKWEGFGTPCSQRCYDRDVACEEPCYESLTDKQGELTPGGWKCVEHCNHALDRCRGVCPP